MRTVTIDWKPQKRDAAALSSQIVQYIKTKIYRGDWLVGDSLPSQRKLAEIFDVNRSTLVAALSELSALGILDSTVGKGTYVANNSWSFLMADAALNWRQYIEHGLHKANLPTIQAINRYEFDPAIIRLSTGEVSPELMPHEAFARVYEKMAQQGPPLNYLEPLGLLELRQALCRYLVRWGISVRPEEVLIVSGSLQALQLISLALLGRGSRILVEEYSYVKSLRVFEFSGMRMSAIATDSEGPMPWTIRSEDLKDSTSILYTIPTFHNPTGRTMGMERRRQLLQWCKGNRLPIIEDDAYRELFFDDLPPVPIKALDDSGNVLYLGSVSKSLAPGMRIGWLVGPEPVIERLGDIKMQTDYGASSISQWMMAHLFDSGLYEQHLTTLRSQLKLRCETVLRLLDLFFHDLGEWNRPKGGFYIWLRVKRAISAEKLFHQLLQEHVLINPGYIYTHKTSTYIRISYSYGSPEEMETGLRVLSELIRRM